MSYCRRKKIIDSFNDWIDVSLSINFCMTLTLFILQVIEPCQVEMERRVSNNHAHHQVLLSDLDVYVSPQVIHLCYDVSKMLTSEENLQV